MMDRINRECAPRTLRQLPLLVSAEKGNRARSRVIPASLCIYMRCVGSLGSAPFTPRWLLAVWAIEAIGRAAGCKSRTLASSRPRRTARRG